MELSHFLMVVVERVSVVGSTSSSLLVRPSAVSLAAGSRLAHTSTQISLNALLFLFVVHFVLGHANPIEPGARDQLDNEAPEDRNGADC